jgi:hypothetical protein
LRIPWDLQDVDGRSHIGSGIAWMTNADSHDSDQNSTLQFKKRQPFGQITSMLLSPCCFAQ